MDFPKENPEKQVLFIKTSAMNFLGEACPAFDFEMALNEKDFFIVGLCTAFQVYTKPNDKTQKLQWNGAYVGKILVAGVIYVSFVEGNMEFKKIYSELRRKEGIDVIEVVNPFRNIK